MRSLSSYLFSFEIRKLIFQLPSLLHLGRTMRKIDADKVMDNLLACMQKTRLWAPIIFDQR